MKLSREERERSKKRIRERIQIKMEQENYDFFPGQDEPDIHRIYDMPLRVAVYVRVSTDDIRQTTSFELQSKYYEEFIVQHPRWTLVKVYADEGISGTTDEHRTGFLQMLQDCKDKKIDLIITKSVSRFSRNNEILLRTVRQLSEQEPPVGILFETEYIYSLNEDSEMALSFQGTMAQEESHAKSRGMETSLRMRLDHGLPLTPELLGYKLNEQGKLIVNHETAHIPKLMFYMYLYGYSTQEIADALTELGKKTYRGNLKWTANGVVNSLRNERYCGDVYTRKTYTVSWKTHKSRKNKGKRPVSHYYDEHEAIVSRDDFIAVQHMLDNAKYGNKSILPELRVVSEGFLKGFVTVNPRWGGFKAADYLQACMSVYDEAAWDSTTGEVTEFVANEGDFDLRGFERCYRGLFDSLRDPYVSFFDKKLKFSAACIRRFPADKCFIEMLVHPIKQQFAVRISDKSNRHAVVWAKVNDGERYPKDIAASAYFDTICSLFDWKNTANRYRVRGNFYENNGETTVIFDASEAEAFIKAESIDHEAAVRAEEMTPLATSGTRVKAIPEFLVHSFGRQYYMGNRTCNIEEQTKDDWKLRLEGQLFDTGKKLNVTEYEALRSYIKEQLIQSKSQEVCVNE